MIWRNLCFLILFILGFTLLAYSQNEAFEPQAAIKSFRGFSLGMSLDKVKEQLQKDPYFNYAGEPDVYFLPERKQLLIECSGTGFIRRAFFQFYEEKLFSLILDLDETLIDFYNLFTTLKNKYGRYLSFSPVNVVWEIQGVRLALEKPLTVKYLDLTAFNKIREEGKATETIESMSLKQFLNEF